MMADAPRVHRCAAAGGSEFMLSYGPDNGPQLLVLQPLFEELNRCRALISTLCRALAGRGIGCWLPDLPGTGESLRALDGISWEDWLDGVRAAHALMRGQTGQACATVAIRGGTLLDTAVDGRRWRFSPVGGRSLLSDLRRSSLASGGDPSAPAGYRFGERLAKPLEAADVVPDDRTRTLRLVSDDRPADLHLEAAPLWRRPEPTRDDALATILADDIVLWTNS
jgi:hypothetical protein